MNHLVQHMFNRKGLYKGMKAGGPDHEDHLRGHHTWTEKLHNLMFQPGARLPGLESQLCQLQLCYLQQATQPLVPQFPHLESGCDPRTTSQGCMRIKRVDTCKELRPVSGTQCALGKHLLLLLQIPHQRKQHGFLITLTTRKVAIVSGKE